MTRAPIGVTCFRAKHFCLTEFLNHCITATEELPAINHCIVDQPFDYIVDQPLHH